ncbi:MAG: hypothetical protein M0C28_07970 [Candidatus Moduliflexus flocculans]|nr:hypothetical protein [Candidatus Moduliflexus flocculans]
MAKIVLPDQEFILKEKEWSGWKRVRFPLIPTQSAGCGLRPLLSQGGPAALRALCLAHQHRSGRPGSAPIDTGVLCRRAGEEIRAFLHQGPPGRHERPGQRRPGRRGIPRSRTNKVLQESRAMLDFELGPVRRRPAVLLHLEHRPAPAHVLAAARPRAHPAHDPKPWPRAYGGAIREDSTSQADDILEAQALARIDKDTTVDRHVSDHGFNPSIGASISLPGCWPGLSQI